MLGDVTGDTKGKLGVADRSLNQAQRILYSISVPIDPPQLADVYKGGLIALKGISKEDQKTLGKPLDILSDGFQLLFNTLSKPPRSSLPPPPQSLKAGIRRLKNLGHDLL